MKESFLRQAENELDDAYEYYQTKQQGLGDKFIQEVKLTLERIRFLPNAWKPLGKYTHQCKIKSFPYAIIYQIRDNSEILIVAIPHSRRKLHYWQDRINKI